tara:strand:+ start:5698 stop:6081 length:384 start_codon:yes stop_codon:yes gene_type:complete
MSFSYTPGLGHAGCYIVSGYPNVTTGSASTGSLDVLDWDQVTSEVVVMNTHGSHDLYVLFAYSALDDNKFKIASGEQHTFDVKTRRIYLSASAVDTTYSVCASLTTIPNIRIQEHSGSGINEVPTTT